MPDELDRILLKANTPFDHVREPHETRRRIENGDVDDLRIEDLLDPVADQVVHRLRLEILGEPALNVVDERQLRIALAAVIEQASVLERDAQAPGNRRKQADITLGEGVITIEVLEGDDPRRPVTDNQRGEQGRLRRFTGLRWLAVVRGPLRPVR